MRHFLSVLLVGIRAAFATVAQAVEARATLPHPMADMFWGDRMGSVTCPFGFMRSAATHVRYGDPSTFEVGARTMMAEMGG